ncbi:hypothetical protein CH296_11145 [Rhodococcus sp. 14-2496-1d]|uniref:hypothetical protein n=1 Tax=Rhodococcus sp. 14-2496-1d TaxID=2023146 RepID=UPI000B9C40BC|nr:hypothetical protein [Rhodococcus sp. 14-2496-1d]OZF33184.1 hypothetical protein CH296_11145 [Rhodococcus sp. 14-2496-1d]
MDEIDVVYIVTEYNSATRESEILGVFVDQAAADAKAQAHKYEALVWAYPTDGGEPIACSDASRL